MATESVATPQISIPAQMFVDRFNGLSELIDRLAEADGVLAILDETFDEDTPANCALGAARRLVQDCREKACEMDWPFSYRIQAENALTIVEEAA